MKLSHVHSVAFFGLQVFPIQIEVDVKPTSQPDTLQIVGLPDAAVRESKERVLTALRNTGFTLPSAQITINLAPGEIKKEGPMYDLPIALAILQACNLIQFDELSDFLALGELGLGGQIRPTRGALAFALFAKKQGKKGIILSAEQASEMEQVGSLRIIGCSTLQQVATHLKEKTTPCLVQTTGKAAPAAPSFSVDIADISGQSQAKRALEIAAAGYHNLLFYGPPGSGKTMLAKAMISLLPPLTTEESLEVATIYSLSGLWEREGTKKAARPFRHPHHTTSYSGLVGGGTIPKPGEISLAHKGVLFLDELPEFPRSILEVLRQPLEDRCITISRSQGCATFPTDMLFIGAMNPCPCGFWGHPKKQCCDTPLQVKRYWNKISGPLLDRIDLHVEVPSLDYQQLFPSHQTASPSSSRLREQTAKLHQCQHQRFQTIKKNAHMNKKELKQYCGLSPACQKLMKHAIDELHLSARSCDRLLRVARTIADLEESHDISDNHLMEALHFRGVKEEQSTMRMTPS